MNINVREGFLPLLARLLLVSEFLIAVNGKIFGWDGQAAYMASHGMHFIAPLLAPRSRSSCSGLSASSPGFKRSERRP